MLLKPDFYFDRITDIPLSFFKENGIKYILLDIDNTLSVHHGQTPIDGLQDWLNEVITAGIKPILVSNSFSKRVMPFARKINIEYVCPSLKPLPFGYLKARNILKFDKNSTVAIGDQLFTDILGGNAYGVKTLLLTPILLETSLRFKIKRKIERKVLKLIKKR